MILFENMIMVGATGRNSGKTELATRIITRFSKEAKIIGLKVSTYHEGDFAFHGKNETPLQDNFCLISDTNSYSDKNTSMMLKSGAYKVYWLRTKAEFLLTAASDFQKAIGNDCVVVCESNSLRKIIKPGLFIMIKNNFNAPIKKTAFEVIQSADMIVPFDGKTLDFQMNKICLKNFKWILNV